MIRLLAHPFPSPLLSSVSCRLFLGLPMCRRSSLLMGEGRGEVEGAESYDGEKAWYSMNHSILSVRIFSIRIHYVRFVFGSILDKKWKKCSTYYTEICINRSVRPYKQESIKKTTLFVVVVRNVSTPSPPQLPDSLHSPNGYLSFLY
jgi:hypothetical protein